MATWKNVRGTWTAKFQHRLHQYKREGFPTRAEARLWELQTREALRKRVSAIRTRSSSFHDLATRYLEDCKVRFQKNTWRAKSAYYRSFLAYLGEDPPADAIPRATVMDYCNQIADSIGAKTANRTMRDLKALYNWALRNDLTTANPVLAMRPYPEERFIKYVPPAEDIAKVLMTADQDDMDLLIVLYHTGGRIGEILRLIWDDVNFENVWIRLWTRKRRGGNLEADQLVMSESLRATLKRRWESRIKGSSFVFCSQDGKPFSYEQKRGVMRTLCKRAGVKEFGFHAIRHHVASILIDGGKATPRQIQQFLRHQRLDTTERYLHDITGALAEVAKILDSVEHPTTQNRTGQRTV